MSAYFILHNQLEPGTHITPINICRPDGLDALKSELSAPQRAYLDAHQFTAASGQAVLLPATDGTVERVAFGAGDIGGYAAAEVQAGALSAKLSAGIYQIQTMPDDWQAPLTAIFWGLGAYKFDTYLKNKNQPATLLLTDDMQVEETCAVVKAVHMGRDLINTPAHDMGPKALHQHTKKLAQHYHARFKATKGKDLLSENYPMIHAVGRAAQEQPRLLELEWGDPSHPRLALVGKGISFDTGGLDLKSAAGMRIMKKDMGGAAHALVLADMIMAADLPVRLHVLLAVAENAVSGNAFRPGDVLSSRKGLSVEIDNTDAEGRLVLGDALTRASEDSPHLIMDFATLTGAARVALGPTLPPFFSNRKHVVDAVLAWGEAELDPLWPMPLWAPYMSMLSSPIADLKNAGGGFAGSVTAALFLQKFIGDKQAWMHFDVYGWNPKDAPGHPKGGEIFAVRALFQWLKDGGLNSLS